MIRWILSIAVVLVSVTRSAIAVTPTPAELDARNRWVSAKFDGAEQPPADVASLQVIQNHDPMQRNARGGKPLNVGGRQFTRGLYCHAHSQVRVMHLPGPGRTLTAIIGVDSNEQTSRGRGSVMYSVSAGGKKLFESPLMREGSSMPVRVELGGAKELLLEVTDGGDGISCDQADWADAKVVLDDASEVWLEDLPEAKPQAVTAEPFFSFRIGAADSRELLARAKVERSSRKLDEHRIARTMTWTDPQTKLIVRCDGIEYLDFPTVEWTVHVKNGADGDSPIIEKLAAIDTALSRGIAGNVTLHHNTGSPAGPVDYQPHASALETNTPLHLATEGGRPTNSTLPYFNLEWPGGGTIAVIGWPGQWSADFEREPSGAVRMTGGQELTHFALHAGEEVRSPLVVLQFYDGDAQRGQNLWRQWMLAHNVPRIGGAKGTLPPPMIGACSSHQMHEMINANQANQIEFIDRYLEEKIPLSYWWMDAGWYVNSGDWPNTGTWEVDIRRFPRGLRAITDHAHAKGVKSIVWFEPERVTPGTWLYVNHPDWLLGKDGEQKLLNLGIPDARKWWTGHADGLLTSQGIDLYRTDYNIDPLPYWRGNDSADRAGITEIRYADGFLAYLDALRQRHPDMLIDTCASGGRRNDLETLRRALTRLRSDYIIAPGGQQNHTMGIASWIPYYGTGINSFDAYTFRSQMCPWSTGVYDVRKHDLDYEALRKLISQWQQVNGFYRGDFYPLTPYSTDNTAWVAWQFHDDVSGAGMVQAFRRGGSFYASTAMKLKGLDGQAKYEVTDLDSGKKRELTGVELSEKFTIVLGSSPGSALVAYRQIP